MARRRAAGQSITPPCAISLPRKMFSVIDSSGISASSWWMITMPACSLARMSLNSTTSPRNQISPSYVPYGYTPESTFISVDLPAPFSPQIA